MFQLYDFRFSHYSEKVRWALDFKGIPYTPRHLLPGFAHGDDVRKPDFIGVFTVARRLLMNRHELSAATGGAVGVLPCSLLWALHRRLSMLSRR